MPELAPVVGKGRLSLGEVREAISGKAVTVPAFPE